MGLKRRVHLHDAEPHQVCSADADGVRYHVAAGNNRVLREFVLRDRCRCITDWLGWVSVAWRVGCCSDTGIVRTLDVPVYATECNDTTLHCLDRDGKTLTIMIDNSGTPQ